MLDSCFLRQGAPRILIWYNSHPLSIDTNSSLNVKKQWGIAMTDVFPRTEYKEEHKLPNAIRKAGYDIKDVKAVIFGHLHIDHAGGLEHFIGSDVPSTYLVSARLAI